MQAIIDRLRNMVAAEISVLGKFMTQPVGVFDTVDEAIVTARKSLRGEVPVSQLPATSNDKGKIYH